MIDFPCAKINLGLNITEKRADGYHNLETVFFPIPICDALEIKTMDERFPSNVACDLKVTGNNVCCNENDNLIVKAYNMIAADFDIPRVHAHLYKNIPSEAGLGGGSSDAAYMIRLLDQRFRINIGNAEMEKYAARLGADCPFFITAEPSYAEGIGEILSPVNITNNNLEGYSLVVVKPQIAVSTKEAFSNITPRKPLMCCREIVAQPIETWKDALCNDFEESIFGIYPKLNDIKNRIYTLGAAYAQMSGSGSSLFGIFKSDVDEQSIKNEFADCRTFVMKL
ncbi:4-(cytidine 5'-diphospho)-2-C-methyl-D-erythritol kinase [uncultured Prevotella sp.]|uniref:4-(cytidine 5'-diphospho)-2-C-methyl-D-erythritol kinase n=1 Tax=uncultured Prevotella sp. TaxID=159272 RepID=UPI002638910F|nr:4-(cytidine 5'-diphospho)-2-C-methyl-D-erythritol kinase [uncultured Prevotella sp.]